MDISLALGGGGVRGFAHIGILRCLEKEGYKVRAVAGTSAGGIIAAFYAAGYSPDEMEALSNRIDQSRILSLSLNNRPGLLSLKNVEMILDESFGERTFDDLNIPCAVVAVDVNSSREVILKTGRIVDAILATIAIPGIFPPKEIGEHELVDGGVLDPVPVSVARLLAPKLPVVAAVLSPKLDQVGPSPFLGLPIKIPPPIKTGITHLGVAHSLKVFMQSIEIGQRMITELRLDVDGPDAIIRPAVAHVGMLDKVDVNTMVELGKTAAEEALPHIKQACSWSNRIKRKFSPAAKIRKNEQDQ